MEFPYSEIEEKIGYRFADKGLLHRAFVHSSYANENGISDNERMEFFGDAILETLVSKYLFTVYPEKDAGELSKARSYVVSAEGLKKAVDEFCLVKYLLIADNAKQVRKMSRKLEANLYEALLAAIYLDGGMECAEKFVLKSLKKYMDNLNEKTPADCKTVLQEYCQSKKYLLNYVQTGRSGPDNKPNFTYALFINGKKEAEGSGSSKKVAEIEAAKAAAAKLHLI